MVLRFFIIDDWMVVDFFSASIWIGSSFLISCNLVK